MTEAPAGVGSRVLALDLGTRRIGLALSDGQRRLAFPRGSLLRSGDPATDRRRIVETALEAGASQVVVGLPLSLDGSRGPAARHAELEAERLRADLLGTGIGVATFDERLTTVQATAALAQGGKRGRRARDAVDGAAATVLLQAWLDRR